MSEKTQSYGQRIKRIIILTAKKVMDPYYAGSAAEVAFFLLMSIVPAILLLAQVLNVFDLSMDVIRSIIDEYANENMASILLPLFERRSSGALSVALVILALWSGSKAIYSLMRITNYSYLGGHPSKNPVTGYLRERARAMLTIFIIIFTLLFAIGIVLFGRVIVEGVLTYLNDVLGGNYNIDDLWLNIRWVFGFVLYFFMVMSIYYLLPSSKKRYMKLISRENKLKSVRRVVGAWLSNSKNTIKTIYPGSIFAAIGMMVVTWFYSLYISAISRANFNILYGSLGAAVLLLLWFYILAFVLVLGIQINSVWEESKHTEEVKDKYHNDDDCKEK